MHQNNHKDKDLVKNFIGSFSELFNKFAIFCVSVIYMIVTEFCEKLKVVSSNFSMTKNTVAPLF